MAFDPRPEATAVSLEATAPHCRVSAVAVPRRFFATQQPKQLQLPPSDHLGQPPGLQHQPQNPLPSKWAAKDGAIDHCPLTTLDRLLTRPQSMPQGATVALRKKATSYMKLQPFAVVPPEIARITPSSHPPTSTCNGPLIAIPGGPNAIPWRHVSGRSQGNMAPCRWILQQLRRAEAEGPQRRNRHGSNSRNPSNRSIRWWGRGDDFGDVELYDCWIVWSVVEGNIEVLELVMLLRWHLGGYPWCLGQSCYSNDRNDGNDGSDDMLMLVICLRVLEWEVGSN